MRYGKTVYASLYLFRCGYSPMWHWEMHKMSPDYPVSFLGDAVGFLSGELAPEASGVDLAEVFATESRYDVDFSDVRGQESAKRALTGHQVGDQSKTRADGRSADARAERPRNPGWRNCGGQV